MKTYYAAIIKPLKSAIVWGTGKTKRQARKDAIRWINDFYPSFLSYKKEEKEALTIIPITERVKKFVDDEGGYEVPPLKLRNGVYDLK